MKDALSGLALLIGLPLSAILLRMAWTLWRMPEWQRRELRERYERRKYTQRMIRFWLDR